MRFNVRGAKTAKGHLCDTCRHQHKRVGDSFKHTTERCQVFEDVIPCPISECSQYLTRGAPTLYEMQQVAWPLLLSKSGGQIGFKPPAAAKELIDAGKAQDPGDVDHSWD